MRVVEKIFKQKFKVDWDQAWSQYGPIVINEDESALKDASDSDVFYERRKDFNNHESSCEE